MSDTFVISVSPANQKKNARRKEVQQLLAHAGHKALECIGVSTLYQLEGDFSRAQADKIVRELLWDSVVEKFAVDDLPGNPKNFFVDVWYKAGVADPAGA